MWVRLVSECYPQEIPLQYLVKRSHLLKFRQHFLFSDRITMSDDNRLSFDICFDFCHSYYDQG